MTMTMKLGLLLIVALLVLPCACNGLHPIGSFFDGGSPGMVNAIAVDPFHSCAILSAGRVFCWGTKAVPGFAGPIEPFDPAPTESAWLTGSAQIFGNDFGSACALMTDHSVRCWGQNSVGQLGRGSVSDDIGAPGPVPGLSARQLAVNSNHRCALGMNGDVQCWGDNTRGETGARATDAPITTPTVVPGLADVEEIAASFGSTCALGRSGGVWCWGSNDLGQAGVPDDGTGVRGLTRVDLPRAATHIACNGATTCAALGGELWCWGVWSVGTANIAAPPTHVATGAEISAIVMTDSFLCVVRTPTSDFESGAGCSNNADAPVGQGVEGIKLKQIRGGVWTSLAVSSQTGCVIDVAGGVSCWGDNSLGQVGTGLPGDFWPQPTPIRW